MQEHPRQKVQFRGIQQIKQYSLAPASYKSREMTISSRIQSKLPFNSSCHIMVACPTQRRKSESRCHDDSITLRVHDDKEIVIALSSFAGEGLKDDVGLPRTLL